MPDGQAHISRIHRGLLFLLAAVFTGAVLASCTKDPDFEPIRNPGTADIESAHGQRLGNDGPARVLLMYMAGMNSLDSYIRNNLKTLTEHYIPAKGSNSALLVYCRFPKNGSFRTENESHLIQLSLGRFGEVLQDTLQTYSADTRAATASTVRNVLRDARAAFPTGQFGVLFSSHGTGWVPKGYYENPSYYEDGDEGISWSSLRKRAAFRPQDVPVPYVPRKVDPSLPAVKSFGEDRYNDESYQIDIEDLAEAIPFKLDYIIFDACLMGGIEVAYALKDKCGLLAFSQAEILAEGLDYKTLAEYLLKKNEPDLEGVCKAFYTYYNGKQGDYRSATISLVDCGQMDAMAEICAELFEQYRSGIQAVDPNRVQPFFRDDYHYYYDLYDILDKAGASPQDLSRLNAVLAKAILYKNATPYFIQSSGFPIKVFSGFSMFLPAADSGMYLNNFYKTLSWNQATGLVR